MFPRIPCEGSLERDLGTDTQGGDSLGDFTSPVPDNRCQSGGSTGKEIFLDCTDAQKMKTVNCLDQIPGTESGVFRR